MENGVQNGAHSNHDRDVKVNGGAVAVDSPAALDKGKGAAAGTSDAAAQNGHGDKTVPPPNVQDAQRGTSTVSLPNQSRMNDLPDEIQHITQGFIPLSTIILRLAQATHDDLEKAIMDAARIKYSPPAINGSAAGGGDPPDDSSEANKARKLTLLKFAQDAHTKWVKALVITDWSRKASTVSKLIDLKAHLDKKRSLFDFTLTELIELKRSLGQARLPRPDLKTALQILTTGEAPWIPEPGYIPPPSLTPEEQLKWIEELNTLLSLRLNLDDYDKIPQQFKNYTIKSGRVTFKVEGEFEVDLTIADEDFEKQFWFIDFRFDFTPSSERLSDALVAYLEGQVNDVLLREGLEGCYRFLHEFVLTHKINELKRQAIDLVRNSWTGNLKVEPLNRALAIQYWTSRYGSQAPKSWVMVAVQSGKQKNGLPDPKHPSHLVARWYRDNKEIKDVKLHLNIQEISAEALLKSAIAKHVEHILSSIHDKLAAAPRFANRQAYMRLDISRSEPLDSSLEMQLGGKKVVKLLIEPITGFAAIQPHTRYGLQGETRINHGGKDPAEDGVACLENIRWGYVVDEFNRRGRSCGWAMTKMPVGNEEVKRLIKTREPFQPVFFQRQGLGQDWFVLMSLSLAGDEWWLIEVTRNGASRAVTTSIQLPFSKGQPELNDKFWNNLTSLAAGMISQAIELGELKRNRIDHTAKDMHSRCLTQQIRIPVIFIRLAHILGSPDSLAQTRAQDRRVQSSAPVWAADTVEVHFRGTKGSSAANSAGNDTAGLGICVDAVLKVKDKHKFKQLQARIDKNVAFDRRTGQFVFHIRGSVGKPVLQALADHIKSIDRLVGFLDAMRCAKGAVQCTEVGLGKVKFSYSDIVLPGETGEPRQWTAILDMSRSGTRLILEPDNPHLRILDLLTKVVNTEKGLRVMMAYMTDVLPILRVFDTLEKRWEEVEAAGQGHIELLTPAADWFAIRYSLPSTAGPARQLTIDVRSKERQAQPYWFTSRKQRGPPSPADDEFKAVLQGVWESRGENWRGLTTGAVAQMGMGVFEMIQAIDDAVRAYATGNGQADDNASTAGLPTQVSQVFSSQGSGNGTPQTSQAQSQKQASQASQGQQPQRPRPSQTLNQNQMRKPSFGKQGGGAKGPMGGKNAPVVVLD
ncbi:mediator complex subunit [Verticillium nonalfalfae]|uniref:Mediator of RNA polymerase II transcription subunit 14 n=1 Tax=Verticillium nonalfalfae TaxID=1051616 RepID=A0A3M9XX61_9PEZI|nr:mediator complex subunit [Verticillium nonalfalfae]RNJ52859.1 mediator complex subunit [Verticillium nonalfalfae]